MSNDFWKDYEPEPTRAAPMTTDELTEPLGCVVVRPLVANRVTPPAQPAPVQSCYCPNCEAMGKELAALKAQPAPVQEPFGYLEIEDIESHSEYPHNCRSVNLWHEGGEEMVAIYTTPPAAQPAPVQETKKSIVEALEAVAAYFYDGPVRNTSVVAACEKALNELAGKEVYKSWTPKDQAKLEDIEQYRMQMAGISTAAIGYWKEGDGIHPDYDTTALRDVAKLYAKYDAIYTARPAPVPLTPEEIDAIRFSIPTKAVTQRDFELARAIEAKLRSKNNG